MEATRVLSCVIVVLVFGTSFGCASRPCRQPRAPELDQTIKQPAIPSSATSSEGGSGRNDNTPLKVRVYQSDGSRQCERRGGKSVETTERELAGIPVYHREKRSDGLMHIQVCGSPTGIINIYEIDSSNLKQAEERGFKRWEE